MTGCHFRSGGGSEGADTRSATGDQVLVGPKRAIHSMWIALFVYQHQDLKRANARRQARKRDRTSSASERGGPEIRDTKSRIGGQVLVGPKRAIHFMWIALFVD